MGMSVSQQRLKMRFLVALTFVLNAVAFTHGCGEDIGNRIVGGNPTDPHEIPWQVGLVNSWSPRPFCGGTIISERFIMTAAHCMGGSFQVLAQEHDVTDNSDGTKHNVKASTSHPNYNDNTYDYDYAIVELVEPLSLTGSSKARAACLPTSSDVQFASGTSFVVSGWGALSEGGNSPDVLHAVLVPHVSDAACNNYYDNYGGITARMICAGQAQGAIDSCQGDSGGPLTWVDPTSSKVKLIGVVSWGVGCARPNNPGVYAEVSSVLPWIESVTGGINPTTAGPNPTTAAPNPTTAGPDPTTAAPNPTTAGPDPSTAAPNPTTAGPDPSTAAPNPTTAAPSDCEVPEWQADGYCDDENNNAACNFDGGDCCNNNNFGWNDYCFDCECLDPNAPCEDVWSQRRCNRVLNWGNCGNRRPQLYCRSTCGVC